MKHDFRPDRDLDGAGKNSSRYRTPELIAIGGIFLAVWIAFALHFLSGGLS